MIFGIMTHSSRTFVSTIGVCAVVVILFVASALCLSSGCHEDILLLGHKSPVSTVAFLKGGALVASGGENDQVILWDHEKREKIAAIATLALGVDALAFSSDGRFLAIASDDDREVKILKNGSVIAFPKENPTGVRVTIWDVEKRTKVVQLKAEGHILSVAFSPKGDYLALANRGSLQLWDVKEWKKVKSLEKIEIHPEGGIVFSPCGKFIAAPGGSSHSVNILEVPDLLPKPALKGHTEAVSCVSFSSKGDYLVSGSWDETVKIWDLSNAQCSRSLPTTDKVTCVACSSDGKYVAAGTWTFLPGLGSEGEILVWETTKWQSVVTRPTGKLGGIKCIAFSPNSTLLAFGVKADNALRLWKLPVEK